jgi:hypothetical protein
MTNDEVRAETLRLGLELLADGRSTEEITLILTTVVVCTLDALYGERPIREHADTFHSMMMLFGFMSEGGRS